MARSPTSGVDLKDGTRRLLAGTAWLAVAYLVCGRLSLLLAIPPGYASAVWPAAGIALAALVVHGQRLWPGVFAGSFLVNYATSFDATGQDAALRSLVVAAAIAGGASLQAAVGAAL